LGEEKISVRKLKAAPTQVKNKMRSTAISCIHGSKANTAPRSRGRPVLSPTTACRRRMSRPLARANKTATCSLNRHFTTPGSSPSTTATGGGQRPESQMYSHLAPSRPRGEQARSPLVSPLTLSIGQAGKNLLKKNKIFPRIKKIKPIK